MKHLLLCRHAKSSWKDASLADIDRPLNKRGKKNAPEMGKRLGRRGIIPDLIVSSPARRALATAAGLAGELGYAKKKIAVVREVYAAYPLKLLEVVRKLDDNCSRVILVGHNPEITVLANLLGGLHLDNIPTGGIVALDFGVKTWQEVREGEGGVVFFDYPRKEDQTAAK